VKTDYDKNNTQSLKAGSTWQTKWGHEEIQCGKDRNYEKDKVQQQGLQSLQRIDVEIKHGMSAVPVMLKCNQENVSPVTTPKRNICTDIPGNSTFHISVKSIHK
jgi:hypothetical protein